MSSMKIEVVDGNLPTGEWWAAQRLRYNIGLVVSGIMAFVVYSMFFFASQGGPTTEAESSMFMTFVPGLGCLLFMGCANVCYYIGPISEWLIRPKDAVGYRRGAYSLGFWFSCLLPFLIPIIQIFDLIVNVPREG